MRHYGQIRQVRSQHLRQIRQVRSQHYHILDLSVFIFILIFYFFYLLIFLSYLSLSSIFLSLSSFNLNILSLNILSFLLNLYLIFYLSLCVILNYLSIACKLGSHQSNYKRNSCEFDTRTFEYFTTCDKFGALVNKLTILYYI